METNVLTRTDRLGERYCNSAKKRFVVLLGKETLMERYDTKVLLSTGFIAVALKKLSLRGEKSLIRKGLLFTLIESFLIRKKIIAS
jgi:hypothetical protein